MEQEGAIVASHHPENKGDENARDRRNVQQVPGIVDYVPVWNWGVRERPRIDSAQRIRWGSVRIVPDGEAALTARANPAEGNHYLVNADTIRLKLLSLLRWANGACDILLPGLLRWTGLAPSFPALLLWVGKAGIPSANSCTSRHTRPCERGFSMAGASKT